MFKSTLYNEGTKIGRPSKVVNQDLIKSLFFIISSHPDDTVYDVTDKKMNNSCRDQPIV